MNRSVRAGRIEETKEGAQRYRKGVDRSRVSRYYSHRHQQQKESVVYSLGLMAERYRQETGRNTRFWAQLHRLAGALSLREKRGVLGVLGGVSVL